MYDYSAIEKTPDCADGAMYEAIYMAIIHNQGRHGMWGIGEWMDQLTEAWWAQFEARE
jgi:hypothetical protein